MKKVIKKGKWFTRKQTERAFGRKMTDFEWNNQKEMLKQYLKENPKEAERLPKNWK